MFALMNAWMCVVSLLGIAAGHRVKILRTKSLGFLRLFGRVIDDLDRANDEHFAGLGDLEERYGKASRTGRSRRRLSAVRARDRPLSGAASAPAARRSCRSRGQADP